MALFAITPFEIAKPPGARAIQDDWPLIDGETFTWEADRIDDLVLAEDEVSLRPGTPEELNPTPPARPYLYAVAKLGITPGEITGIEVASKFSAALYLDVGFYFVFFAESQPDTSYLANAYDATTKVGVTDKQLDYIVIEARDASGEPTDPAEISIEIIRVQ